MTFLTMHMVGLREMEVTHLIREGWSFLMWAEASIKRFNSSALVLELAAYTRDFVCPQTVRSGDIGGQATGPCDRIQRSWKMFTDKCSYLRLVWGGTSNNTGSSNSRKRRSRSDVKRSSSTNGPVQNSIQDSRCETTTVTRTLYRNVLWRQSPCFYCWHVADNFRNHLATTILHTKCFWTTIILQSKSL
jgi:hypothetical protein